MSHGGQVVARYHTVRPQDIYYRLPAQRHREVYRSTISAQLIQANIVIITTYLRRANMRGCTCFCSIVRSDYHGPLQHEAGAPLGTTVVLQCATTRGNAISGYCPLTCSLLSRRYYIIRTTRTVVVCISLCNPSSDLLHTHLV